MLCCLQHKSWNYFQAEEKNLSDKGTPLDFDFKYFSKKILNFLLKL